MCVNRQARGPDHNVDVPGVQISSLGWSEVSCWPRRMDITVLLNYDFATIVLLAPCTVAFKIHCFTSLLAMMKDRHFRVTKHCNRDFSCRWLILELPRLWRRVHPVRALPFTLRFLILFSIHVTLKDRKRSLSGKKIITHCGIRETATT